jgi:hypothetical protein
MTETFKRKDNSKNIAIAFAIYFLCIGFVLVDIYNNISMQILDPKINHIILFVGGLIFLGSIAIILKGKNGSWNYGFEKVNVDDEGNFHLVNIDRPDIKFSVSEIKKIKIYKDRCTINLKDRSFVTFAVSESDFLQKIVEHPKLKELSHPVKLYKEILSIYVKIFLSIIAYICVCYILMKTFPSITDTSILNTYLFELVITAAVLWLCSRNKSFALKENALVGSAMLALLVSTHAEMAYSTDDLKFEEMRSLNSEKKYDDSFIIAKMLYAKYPDKSFVNQAYALLLLKQNSTHADQAIAILEKYPHEVRAKQIIACAYAEKQQWDKAMAYAQAEEYPKDSKRMKEHQSCRAFAKEEVQLSSEAK